MSAVKEITIVYEDNDVVVIDKPSGLVVHSDGKTAEPSVADWVLVHYPKIKDVGEPWKKNDGTIIMRPGVVHRLDRETSGVLVIAKNQRTFLNLKQQFSAPALDTRAGRDLASGGQARAVKKIYNAFVYGVLKEKKNTITRPIGKSSKDFRLRSAQRGARGALREAVTEYRVLKESKEATYIEVQPKTGRTHQIRVHFKAIHHPVVCDSLYAPKRECLLGFTRLALHARSISFTLPDGEHVTAEAPLPDDFEKALKMIT